MSFQVLGIDPGTLISGVCELAFEEAGFRLLWLGHIPNEQVYHRISSTHLVAVETPGGGVFGAARGKNIVRVANVAGHFSRCAIERGCRVEEPSPEDWRKAVVGKRTPSDKAIKEAVVPLIAGWPKRSRDHHRDAAGVAIYAARLMVAQGRMVA